MVSDSVLLGLSTVLANSYVPFSNRPKINLLTSPSDPPIMGAYQVYSQRVQSTYMVQSMVSVVVISLMVWVSIPHMGT